VLQIVYDTVTNKHLLFYRLYADAQGILEEFLELHKLLPFSIRRNWIGSWKSVFC